jgi:uncharacterized protein HemX
MYFAAQNQTWSLLPFMGLCMVLLLSTWASSLSAQETKPAENTPTATTGAEKNAKNAPKKRMDGPTRAKIFAALAGIAIFGIGIVLLAWLAGRMTRRMLQTTEEQRQKYLTTEQLTRDDWADKPLTAEERHRIFNVSSLPE